jgi:glycosyltransferase 2 family protein
MTGRSDSQAADRDHGAAAPVDSDEPQPSVQVSERDSRSMLARILPKLLLSLALGGACAYFVSSGGVPLVPPVEELSKIAPWTVPVYLLSLCAVHWFRATRWRFLIAPVKRVPMRDVVLLNWIGFFAIFALPLRLGELARPALTKLRHGIPISVGLGTVAVERVIDGFITSLCVAWALLALPRMETQDRFASLLPKYGYSALALFTCAFIALGLFLWQRELAARLTRMTLGLISPRVADVLARKVDNVADGIRSISEPRLALLFVLESVLYWSCNAAGVWLLGVGCGLPMTLGHAAAVMGVLAIGILLPSGPGLFGNFQLAVSAGLRLYFAEALVGHAGATFIFLLYVLQSSVMIVAGIIPLYALGLRMTDLVRLPAESEHPPPP